MKANLELKNSVQEETEKEQMLKEADNESSILKRNFILSFVICSLSKKRSDEKKSKKANVRTSYEKVTKIQITPGRDMSKNEITKVILDAFKLEYFNT